VKTSFALSLLRQAGECLGNCHRDNWEPRRAFPRPERSVPEGVDEVWLAEHGYVYVQDLRARSADFLDAIEPLLPGLERTYDRLADAPSRDLLVKLFAYRWLGHERVRLPLPTADYHARIEELEGLAEEVPGLVARVPAREIPLAYMDLSGVGIPLRLLATPLAVYNIFCAEQYAHHLADGCICVREGDTVLDLGGCWGDTALDFSIRAGASGRIIAFEFLPQNLEILERNLQSNPSLGEQVRVLRRAAWSRTGNRLYFADRGPATLVTAERSAVFSQEVETISIDDLVGQESLGVDFIKMDIEGAELEALRGAERTLREQRPELAISLYHRLHDFVEIPDYLASLDLGYRFYLGNATIFESETVLFAQSDRGHRSRPDRG
jgi:FkbM family methyltransferase